MTFKNFIIDHSSKKSKMAIENKELTLTSSNDLKIGIVANVFHFPK